ncbi:MAG TPA: VCBS repeat-containing protein [Candidatus Hydrogenedentes bacterium]|nr:VCBS repeat-containing protein [Candidatus Hydrogenedentota bacterium]
MKWKRVLYALVAWTGGVCLLSTANADIFTKHGRRVSVGPNPSAVVAEDMNDDGLPEIFTADTGRLGSPDEERPANDEVSFLLARGKLDYATQPPLRVGFAPMALLVTNLDGLKAPDLLVASFHTQADRPITLFRNLGENRFETAGPFSVPAQLLTYHRMLDGDNKPVYTSPGVTSLAAFFANRDECRDVIATAWASDALLYFPGDRNAYLGEPQIIPASGGPRDVRAVDLDGDALVDLAVTMYVSGEIGLWRGDGTGNFTPATRLATRGPFPHKIRVADMNGDGKPDLIVSHCFSSDSIEIFYGNGGFQFPVSQEIMFGKNPKILEHEIRDIVVDDLNGDGSPDIAAACYTSQQVFVLLNRPGSGPASRSFVQESYSFVQEGKPRALHVADLNQDGARDLLVALWGSNEIAFLLGTPPPAPQKQPPAPKPATAKTKK